MPRTKELSDISGEDIIDIRDVIARVEELEDEREQITDRRDDTSAAAVSRAIALKELARWDEENGDELKTLRDMLDECRGNGGDERWRGDWYPVTLIRDSYFKTYAQELADDIGAINSKAGWPNSCIDWNQAARELQMDYTAIEFDGVTYWTR